MVYLRVYVVLAIITILCMFVLKMGEDTKPDQLAFMSTMVLL